MGFLTPWFLAGLAAVSLPRTASTLGPTKSMSGVRSKRKLVYP